MKHSRFVKFLAVLVIISMVISPALASFTNDGYENKYKDYNPVLNPTQEDLTGALVVHLRAGGSAEDTTIFICPEGANSTPFDNSYHHDRSIIVGQNDWCQKVEVLPDGNTEYIRLPPGNYTIHLRNGNSEQPEQQSVTIVAKYLTDVSFLGHAVSGTHYPDEKLEVISAWYGAEEGCEIIYHPEVNHTVHHEASTHNITVVDKEAWNETVVDKEAWNETVIDTEAWDEYIYHAEVNHTVYYPETNHTVYHPEVNHTVHHANTTSQVWIPEVNHTEKRVSTWNASWTEYLGSYEHIGGSVSSNYRYTSTGGDYSITLVGIPHKDDDACHPDGASGNYKCGDGKWGTYKLTYVGHISHEGSCVAGSWEIGTCPVSDRFTVMCPQPNCGCEQRIVVDTAGYFKTVDNMDGYDEVIVDQRAYTEIVVDTEAHSEIIVDEKAWTETIHHEAGTHIVYHEAITHVVQHPAETHEETITDKEPWDEIIVDTPAWSEKVCGNGGYIDVTAIVAGQMKCKCGCGCSIFIDSDNYDTLFGDPAPDYYKHLTVEYKYKKTVRTVTVGEDVDLLIPQEGSSSSSDALAACSG